MTGTESWTSGVLEDWDHARARRIGPRPLTHLGPAFCALRG